MSPVAPSSLRRLSLALPPRLAGLCPRSALCAASPAWPSRCLPLHMLVDPAFATLRQGLSTLVAAWGRRPRIAAARAGFAEFYFGKVLHATSRIVGRDLYAMPPCLVEKRHRLWSAAVRLRLAGTGRSARTTARSRGGSCSICARRASGARAAKGDATAATRARAWRACSHGAYA
eukprot:2807408-Pleurochrysis_carterae.AAC.1